jgi:hypothetical protein
MPKSKDLEELERGESGRSQSNGPEAGDHAISLPEPDKSGTYERCMQAYRWLSRRYRKTLDALAK